MNKELDPVTFEILRNRLRAINDEAAAAIRVVSGSPVANEVFDYNTALLTPEGDVFVIGTYIAIHAIAMDQLVKAILREYQENPGISEDDMFICNNPYEGAMHQADVALVAPVHHEGEIILWVGAVIHQVDVGGPMAGQVAIEASSIYEEAPVMPPLKIVEGGVIRKDIEREYLIRSRVPDLVGLDFRAKMAANNTAKNRIKGLIQKYGVETVKATIREIIDLTEKKFRARLRDIPDGVFRHRSYLDFKGDIYKGMLILIKENDKLIFDFTGTSKQAPAVVNCTYGGLLAGILIAILGYMCYDMPWCPAGVMRAIEVTSEPGTFINSSWPAGASKATTSGNWIVINLCSQCLGEMLSSNPRYRDHLMAIWAGTVVVAGEIFGINQRGEPFGTTLLDGMASGAGARSFKDGIDTGSFYSAPSIAVSNIESYEAKYPLLYFYRRQERDSGGPGKFRGGVSMSLMWKPHKVLEIPSMIIHGAFDYDQAEGVGISGGYPGCSSHVSFKRDTNIHKLLETGKSPQSLNEVEGRMEISPPMVKTYVKGDDIFETLPGAGGGGYGDPLDRESELVGKDIVNGLVSLETAFKIYGVVADPQGRVDMGGTIERRKTIKEERKRTSQREGVLSLKEGAEKIGELNEFMEVIRSQREGFIRCLCGFVISPARENYKLHLLRRESPMNEAGPLVNLFRIREERFTFREFFCPGCARLLATEVALKGDPILWNIQPKYI